MPAPDSRHKLKRTYQFLSPQHFANLLLHRGHTIWLEVVLGEEDELLAVGKVA